MTFDLDKQLTAMKYLMEKLAEMKQLVERCGYKVSITNYPTEYGDTYGLNVYTPMSEDTYKSLLALDYIIIYEKNDTGIKFFMTKEIKDIEI